jgi:hypothetical protein
MRFMKFLFCIGLLSICQAKADFYFHPQAGMAIPVNGNDASYSLGLTAGYQWNRYFATEASYVRLIGTGSAVDGDLFKGEGILGFPGEWITPYVSGGVGLSHIAVPGSDPWDPMILLGGGAVLHPVNILSLGVGVSYAIVKDQPDFISPVVSIGLNF